MRILSADSAGVSRALRTASRSIDRRASDTRDQYLCGAITVGLDSISASKKQNQTRVGNDSVTMHVNRHTSRARYDCPSCSMQPLDAKPGFQNKPCLMQRFPTLGSRREAGERAKQPKHAQNSCNVTSSQTKKKNSSKLSHRHPASDELSKMLRQLKSDQ